MTRRFLRVAAGLAALATAAPARAQSVLEIDRVRTRGEIVPAGASVGCLERIPDATLVRTNYFLLVEAPPGARSDGAATPFWAAVAGDLAGLVRGSLGSAGDSLPRAEPVLDWRSVSGGVVVTAFRDHRFGWRVERGRAATAADSLLVGALAAVGGGPLPPWPEGAGDSSSVMLAFDDLPAWSTAHVLPPGAFALPVFTLGEPPFVPAAAGGDVSPSYPEHERHRSVEATVKLGFVIDTRGRVDRASVRDVEADAGLAHGAFVDASVDAVVRHRFIPATVGGCAVPMWVQQAFEFRLEPRASVVDTITEPPPLPPVGRRGAPPR
jgi:TonB family protein